MSGFFITAILKSTNLHIIMNFSWSLLPFIFIGCSVSKTTSEPSIFQGDTIGCGHFSIYQFSEDGKMYVSVRVHQGFTFQESQAFDLSAQDQLTVRWNVFDSDVRNSLCNDVMPNKKERPLNHQLAKSGNVKILMSQENLDKKADNQPYKVTVRLSDIVFEGLTINELQMDNVLVGWIPG